MLGGWAAGRCRARQVGAGADVSLFSPHRLVPDVAVGVKVGHPRRGGGWGAGGGCRVWPGTLCPHLRTTARRWKGGRRGRRS